MQIWNAMNLQQRSGLAGAMGRGAQLSLFGGAADAHGDPGPATRRSWEVFQSEGHPKMQEKTCGICRVKSCSNPSLVSSDDGKKALVSCSSLLFMALHLHKFIQIQQRRCAWFLLAVAVNCCGGRLYFGLFCEWFLRLILGDESWFKKQSLRIPEMLGTVSNFGWMGDYFHCFHPHFSWFVPRLFIYFCHRLNFRWDDSGFERDLCFSTWRTTIRTG